LFQIGLEACKFKFVRLFDRPKNGFPVYDWRGRQIDFVQETPKNDDGAKAKRDAKEVLKNPQMYRAYWWHVVIRTFLEVGHLNLF